MPVETWLWSGARVAQKALALYIEPTLRMTIIWRCCGSRALRKPRGIIELIRAVNLEIQPDLPESFTHPSARELSFRQKIDSDY